MYYQLKHNNYRAIKRTINFSIILILDITTNSAPKNICNLFISTQDIHQYNTRSASSGNYYINYSRLNHHKNSFSIVGAKIWNSIPESYPENFLVILSTYH